MNVVETPSNDKAIHEDVPNDKIDEHYKKNLQYLSLCGLPLTSKICLDDDAGNSLAYLNLNGLLAKLALSSKFKAYFDLFHKLELGDCVDLYQNVVEERYRRDQDPRILEVYINACERFSRCNTRPQRKKVFDRVLDNLFETNSDDVSPLKLMINVIKKNDYTLREISFVTMNPFKLNYFFQQLKKCYADELWKDNWSNSPLQVLLNHDLWGPVHKCFAEPSASNLAVALNNGFELKITKPQLQWYLKNILTSKGNPVYDENFYFWFNYSKDIQLNGENKAYRRLLLTFQLLYVIMNNMDTMHRRCLRLIWRTLPDHYITAEELELVTKEMPLRKKMIQAYEAFVNTEKYFEVKSYINRPRYLKHYCRCVIRKCLIRNRKLPEGISSLELPTVLQSYLLLECTGTSTPFAFA